MKAIGSKLLCCFVILMLSCTLFACGSDVELRPELQAHLDEYEHLIDTYQAKFAGVRGNPPAFADVADAYSAEVKAWATKLDTVAPTMSDEEGRAVKARIDSLNKRAVRMLSGN